ncbi:uncharacterized protein LOC117781733 [Drosophila innubila]|uniref:uncharacterized protein LOC117781733 n=1 Tax=Drosophila innubila TaxID=198719 RepID=UPI00148BA54B|nr:uncharacterized protein LOC117781733 [Drosophila innubila]
MGVSQRSSFLYLFGFFLLFNGVFAKPSLIQPKDVAQDQGTSVVFANPSLIHSKDLVQDRTISNLNYPINYQVDFYPTAEKNFTGFRSVFQWTIGKTFNKYGIHNAMEFSVNDSLNSQLFGQIGIYSNGSKIGVQLSLITPKVKFTINSSTKVISNAIYFLDVEINNNTLSGYISGPQSSLSRINDPKLPRNEIGTIYGLNKLSNLKLVNYFVANLYEKCDLTNEITTYNYIPQLYNKEKRLNAVYYSSSIYNLRICGPINTLAMTDWNAVVYISRPTLVLNGTSSMN